MEKNKKIMAAVAGVCVVLAGGILAYQFGVFDSAAADPGPDILQTGTPEEKEAAESQLQRQQQTFQRRPAGGS